MVIITKGSPRIPNSFFHGGSTPHFSGRLPLCCRVTLENHLCTITAFSTLQMDSPSALVIEEKLSGTWTKASEV